MTHDLIPKEEPYTLLLALKFLDRYDYTDTMMVRKYGLNRSTLRLVRNGKRLKNSHDFYIRCYLKEMKKLLDNSRNDMNDSEHKKIKDLMFVLMSREMGI